MLSKDIDNDVFLKNHYRNKRILITGGTGSIGSQVVKQLLQFSPQQLVIFSKDESKQYVMKQEITAKNVHFILGDIREYVSIEHATRDIDIVFHTAALKQVPMCEENPYEAVKTNMIGSQNLIEACITNKVGQIINISTDKAVNPINTMGATKLITEKLFQQANERLDNHSSRFCSVRFGNVLGSRGSVIPIMLQQIRKKRPITITDSNMTRFFLSITDAVTLLVKAGAYSNGGETFILRMNALKLDDLVHAMQELAAAEGFSPVAVVNIGIRPGEKLYEELVYEHELANLYEKDDLYIVSSQTAEDLQKSSIRSYRSDQVPLCTREELKIVIRNIGVI